MRAAAAHPPRRQRQRRPQAVALAAAAQPGDSTPAVPQQQQQQQDKPLPPYYQLSLPVYSLATVDPDGGSPTMNLVTYASPISLKPRHYALGLYLGTLSWQNMLATKTGVLQVLGCGWLAAGAACRRWMGVEGGQHMRQMRAHGCPASSPPVDPVDLLPATLPPRPARLPAHLQVLREQHAPLFELLGRTSGRDVDKLAQLTERGVGFTRRPADGIPLLVGVWVDCCVWRRGMEVSLTWVCA